MKRITLALLAAAALPAQAGAWADALGQCLVEAATPQDRAALARWVFANTALHPDLAGVSAVTPAQRDGLNRGAAQVLQRLVTENCRKPTQDAVRSEGPGALQAAFQMLGQSALQELAGHPQVGRGFADTVKYLDAAKLLELTLGR